jgi:hypothetical protein
MRLIDDCTANIQEAITSPLSVFFAAILSSPESRVRSRSSVHAAWVAMLGAAANHKSAAVVAHVD